MHHPDPLEEASERQSWYEAQCLAAVIEREKPKPTVYCVECDEAIPQERQKATGGTNLCIDCKELQEW